MLCGQRTVTLHCALVCVAFDLPAGRKTCGFLSYSALAAIYHNFCTGTFGVRNYSGFNKHDWILRTNENHRKYVTSTLKCKSKTEREKKESEVGCRYSILLELPYFFPVRMLIIDPMHNLYLGTARTIFRKVWMQQLSKAAIASINQRVSNLVVPATVRFSNIPSPIEYILFNSRTMDAVGKLLFYLLHAWYHF